jgi:hypothetical protein
MIDSAPGPPTWEVQPCNHHTAASTIPDEVTHQSSFVKALLEGRGPIHSPLAAARPGRLLPTPIDPWPL